MSNIPDFTLNDYLLCLRDITKNFRVSRSYVYLAMAKGQFPAAVKVGRSTRWRAADVKAWADNLPHA